MKLLRLALLLGFLAVTANTQAQNKQLFFQASLLSQPNDFFYPFVDDEVSKMPIPKMTLGWQQNFGKSQLFYEASLTYLFVKSETTFETNLHNDPAIPPVLQVKNFANLGGMMLGAGYSASKRSKLHGLSLTAGAQAQFSFASKRQYLSEEEILSETETYRTSNGFLYGLYLKPTYSFDFSKKPSPWRFQIFAESSMLWRYNFSEGNPLFMAGGGLGVSYTLN